MLSHLHRIRKEFTSLLTFVFICLVILCPLTLIALGSLSVTEMIVAIQQKWFALFTLVFAAWIAVHFWHFLDPVFIWVEYDRNNQDAPNQLHKRLNVFTRSYWGFFMGYAIVSPLLYNLSISHTLLYKGLDHTLTMILVQMVVVYLVSMPVYLLTVDRLGKLVNRHTD